MLSKKIPLWKLQKTSELPFFSLHPEAKLFCDDGEGISSRGVEKFCGVINFAVFLVFCTILSSPSPHFLCRVKKTLKC
jgi:hypothetical protein